MLCSAAGQPIPVHVIAPAHSYSYQGLIFHVASKRLLVEHRFPGSAPRSSAVMPPCLVFKACWCGIVYESRCKLVFPHAGMPDEPQVILKQAFGVQANGAFVLQNEQDGLVVRRATVTYARDFDSLNFVDHRADLTRFSRWRSLPQVSRSLFY